ncbi:hypothetical protein A2U01_0076282, partial [Trifolium medium]|nr:hypothetical protein [Trifolium medium]
MEGCSEANVDDPLGCPPTLPRCGYGTGTRYG